MIVYIPIKELKSSSTWREKRKCASKTSKVRTWKPCIRNILYFLRTKSLHLKAQTTLYIMFVHCNHQKQQTWLFLFGCFSTQLINCSIFSSIFFLILSSAHWTYTIRYIKTEECQMSKPENKRERPHLRI